MDSVGIRQISVFITDEPGTLAELTETLMQNDISMRALSVADSKDFGIVRMITEDADQTVAVLEDAGFVCKLTRVLAFEIEDRSGSMFKLLKTLGDTQVNIDYSYAFTTYHGDKAYLVVRVEDVHQAAKALQNTDVKMLTEKEVAALS